MNRWLYSADAASAGVCEMDAQGAKMPGGRLGTCLALLVHQLILCMWTPQQQPASSWICDALQCKDRLDLQLILFALFSTFRSKTDPRFFTSASCLRTGARRLELRWASHWPSDQVSICRSQLVSSDTTCRGLHKPTYDR